MREWSGDDLNYLSTFERVTGIFPSDYFLYGETMAFLVEPTQLGAAVGKNGTHVHRLKNLLRKKVFIVANDPDPTEFARRFFANIRVLKTEVQNDTLVLFVDDRDRGFAIGKDGERIKLAKEILAKKFRLKIDLRTRRVL